MIKPLLFAPLRAGLFLFVPPAWIYYKIFLQPLEHFGFLVSYMVGGQNHYHNRKENFMKNSNDSLILGIDHGYGNIKTANKTFGTGVYVSDTEPAFKNNLLTWNGKYYTIGEGHKAIRRRIPIYYSCSI